MQCPTGRMNCRACSGVAVGFCSPQGPSALTQGQEAAVDVVGLHGELPAGAGVLHSLTAGQIHKAQRALLAGARLGKHTVDDAAVLHPTHPSLVV